MTRKVIHMVLLVATFFLLTSKSCAPDDAEFDEEARHKAVQEYTLNEIKSEFEAEYLSDDQLLVYNEKARQKVLDLADYLSLYADGNLDSSFKQQIKDVIYRLFYNKNAIVQLSIREAKESDNMENSINGLLYDIDVSDYQSVDFMVSDMKITEPLHLQGVEKYTGRIGCDFLIRGISASDTTILYENPGQATIVATLTNKQFGDDTSLMIWQVFLEDIVMVR